MRQAVTEQENGHAALVRDVINALAAELRTAMKATGEDSQSDMVWLSLAAWMRNHSMMSVTRQLATQQALNQPLMAGGRVYLLRLERLGEAPQAIHRITLHRQDDHQNWSVEQAPPNQ